MPLATRSLVLGPFETNAYIVTCVETRETAVIDVGFDPGPIADRIQADGLVVRHLLNTHAHYDHIAGMRELQQRVGGEYWLHPDDRFLADAVTAQGSAFGLPPSEAPSEIHDLADGQILEFGRESLAVLHTPGHSPGSVTFRNGDTLWVGDVLFAGSIGRTDLPGGSFEILKRTIRERLFPLGDDLRVLPGHGPATTIGAERRSNPFVGDDVDWT